MKITNLQQCLEILSRLSQIQSSQTIKVVFEYKDNPKNRNLGRVGKTRTMICSFDTHQYSKGGLPAYNPKEKRLFWVVDHELLDTDSPIRSLPWDTIKEVIT